MLAGRSTFVSVLLLSLTLLLVNTALSPAVAASGLQADPTVRYGGLVMETMRLDTSRLNAVMPSDKYAPLGNRVVLVGIEGVAGRRGDWAFGSFGYNGKITSESKANQAELSVVLAGASVQTLVQQRGDIDYIAEVKVGGGRLTWTLIQPSGPITNLGDAVSKATTTTLETPVWFVAPSFGIRAQFSQLVILEAKLGYGLSMSSGEWRLGSDVVGTAQVTMGGPVLSVGVKIGSL